MLRWAFWQDLTRLVQSVHVGDTPTTRINEELPVQDDSILPGRPWYPGFVAEALLLGRKENGPLQVQSTGTLVCMSKHHGCFGDRLVGSRLAGPSLRDDHRRRPALGRTQRAERQNGTWHALANQEVHVLRARAIIPDSAGDLNVVSLVIQPLIRRVRLQSHRERFTHVRPGKPHLFQVSQKRQQSPDALIGAGV